MKKQIVVIHGGDTFKTYEDYLKYLLQSEITLERLFRKDWKSTLHDALADFEIISPEMPNKRNAKYLEWKIWFEKILPLLGDEVVFIGHSLGGIFLAKYLSEHAVSKSIRATHLVAAPFDNVNPAESLEDFRLPDDLRKFAEQGGDIFLYHSKDDKVVPFENLEKYRAQLPAARVVEFEDREHFNQKEFPEIIRNIRAAA